jgi:hypothetical protein
MRRRGGENMEHAPGWTGCCWCCPLRSRSRNQCECCRRGCRGPQTRGWDTLSECDGGVGGCNEVGRDGVGGVAAAAAAMMVVVVVVVGGGGG